MERLATLILLIGILIIPRSNTRITESNLAFWKFERKVNDNETCNIYGGFLVVCD